MDKYSVKNWKYELQNKNRKVNFEKVMQPQEKYHSKDLISSLFYTICVTIDVFTSFLEIVKKEKLQSVMHSIRHREMPWNSTYFLITFHSFPNTAKHTGLTLLSAGLLLLLLVPEHKVISGRVSKINKIADETFIIVS